MLCYGKSFRIPGFSHTRHGKSKLQGGGQPLGRLKKFSIPCVWANSEILGMFKFKFAEACTERARTQ